MLQGPGAVWCHELSVITAGWGPRSAYSPAPSVCPWVRPFPLLGFSYPYDRNIGLVISMSFQLWDSRILGFFGESRPSEVIKFYSPKISLLEL